MMMFAFGFVTIRFIVRKKTSTDADAVVVPRHLLHRWPQTAAGQRTMEKEL